ncbi:short chain dehydrogenase reductase family protein [Stylonychia lemnae]|uniref:Short chain dehydrogenase reductase family protein n=1 Tax=Stylonychia lemnae TaxID=5949 RepID=A0A078A8Y9_STYLE|nr:short chain dehydrogenase reductase family protein [Stylonychia lemnae]|eukprot:CDW78684.1 short chain dehydrogenase reductase family protein [Stylonychia lemnae]
MSTKPPYFADKKVLITGASSGVGMALAYWYLNNGAQVALVGRDIETLSKIGEQFPSQSLEMALSVIEKMGGLDILINAAGLIFDGDIQSTFPQDYDYLMDINLRCAFHMTLIFHKYLGMSKGCIVNVSCSQGSKPNAGTIGYCMTKAGLEMLTKSSALELAPLGIRVNAVSPATLDTNLYRYTGMTEQEYQNFKKRAATNIPMNRIGTVEEVAKAIIFLSSEQQVTGHIMKVDGGKQLTSSGYIPWYGMEMMNRRFEPDYLSNINYWMANAKDKIRKSKFDAGTEEWIQEIQNSNWATHNEDAHFKVMQEYKKENMNDDEVNHYLNMHKEGGVDNPKAAKRV